MNNGNDVMEPTYGARLEFKGNLANEPKMSYTKSGLEVCEITVAVDPPKDKKTHEETSWIRVVTFGGVAVYINEHADVGDTLAGRGRYRQDKVKRDDGKTSIYPKVIAFEMYHRKKGQKSEVINVNAAIEKGAAVASNN